MLHTWAHTLRLLSDLPKVVDTATTFLYADDITVSCVGESVDQVTTTLNKALGELALRCKQNSLVPHPKMCTERSLKETIIHSKYFPNSDWLKAPA